MTRKHNLFLHLDKASEIPLYRQIYVQIREGIAFGSLTAGDKLPSIRRLAQDAGISHTTAEQAYLQLSMEGLVRNIPRSGYVVEQFDTEFLQLEKMPPTDEIGRIMNERNRDAFYAENMQGRQACFDFSYANLPPSSFPVDTWRKLINDILFRKEEPEFARYISVEEPNLLRRELASYLNRSRGVVCLPDQVIVQAGTDGALNTILQLFDRENDIVGMEEPGYATVYEVCRRNGFSLTSLPTEESEDDFIAALEASKPRIVFCTPSHQFPTGRVLSIDARTRLLKWAADNDAYIIEDDSCNEYRYDILPAPSLQSLDAFNRVIYLGNVSKALSPSLRVSFIVLPPAILARYLSSFKAAHPPVSWFTQELLGRFFAEGHWDAHVRRIARTLERNHDELLACLRQRFGDCVKIQGENSGMHFYVTVGNNMTQQELIASAYEQGAMVYGTTRMWFDHPAPENRLMIGFSCIAVDDIAPGVDALAKAWLA